MGNSINKGIVDCSAEELAAVCEANNSPDVVVRAIRENNINGATLNELDEATIESIGKTLLEKKQLLGEYHKCMPQTITLPPLIKSPQRRASRMRSSPSLTLNNSLRDKISPIKSPLQVNNSNANTLNFNLSASPTNGKKLQTVKIEKYDDGEILEIINSMSQYPDDEDVQQYGCKQFGVLAKENIQTCQYLGKIDGIQLILNAMRNCPNAKRVLVDATFAITNFIKDDNNRLMAIEKGAIEMIRSALDTFDGDAELMEVAYPCLTLLGEDVEEEKRQFER